MMPLAIAKTTIRKAKLIEVRSHSFNASGSPCAHGIHARAIASATPPSTTRMPSTTHAVARGPSRNADRKTLMKSQPSTVEPGLRNTTDMTPMPKHAPVRKRLRSWLPTRRESSR